MASLGMNMVKLLLRAGGKPMARTDRYLEARRHRAPPEPPAPPAALKAERVEVARRPVYLILPEGGLPRRRIIYFHGGAYVNPMRPIHWKLIAALGRAAEAEMIVPIYPLAPEHDHREGFVFAEAVLHRYGGAPFLMAGDSAGGNMALAMALRGREGGVPVADRVICFAPWLDLSCANPIGPQIEPRDPMIALQTVKALGRWWAGPADPADPALSPLHAGARGLPPVDIHQGTADLCWPDAVEYATALKKAGNGGHYYEYPGAFHVFPAVTFLRESRQAYARIARDVTEMAPPRHGGPPRHLPHDGNVYDLFG